MYHMNMVNHFYGDVILVVILLKQVVNNGLIQNLTSKINKTRIYCKYYFYSSFRFFFYRNESPYPFCISSPKPSLSKRICAYTYDKIVMCNLVEYPNPLPIEYQVYILFIYKIS